MAVEGRAYVVRDADVRTDSGEVIRAYAYTLKGLTTALEEARFHSFRGIPQVVLVMADGKSTIIRRFQNGHEVPVTP